MIAYVAYLSVSDIESECHIQKQKDGDREREKVARQRGAKIRPASCWEAVESYFTEGKVKHLDIFVPLQREIISEQLLIDNVAHL